MGITLAGPAWAADYSVGGSTRADVSGFGQYPSARDLRNDAGTDPLGPWVVLSEGNVTGAHSQGGGAVTALGETVSRVNAGGVHIHAHASSEIIYGDPLSGEASYAWAQATGQYADFFSLNVPGYAPGTMFTLTGRIRIDATALPSTDLNAGNGWVEASAGWQAWAGLTQWVTGGQSASLLAQQSCAMNLYGSGCTGDSPGWYTLSFSMANQTMQGLLSLGGMASASSVATISGGGLAVAAGVADLGHTIAWGGFTEVRDPSGILVIDFAAPSSSNGFDYRHAYVSAVPEAGSAVSMAAGLALFGVQWLRRRRRA